MNAEHSDKRDRSEASKSSNSSKESKNEATTTIRRVLRETEKAVDNFLEEQLSLLSPEDRAVVLEIQSSLGEKAMLFIAKGPAKGSRFLITAEGVTVGRASQCSVFLDDVTVSRSHATITKQADGFLLKDEGSLNGTYVNNISITQHLLASGDQFQIGKFHFLFICSN